MPIERFHQFLLGLSDQEAFLGAHSQPALLIEPYQDSGVKFELPQEGSQSGMWKVTVAKKPGVMAPGARGAVHQDARLAWLTGDMVAGRHEGSALLLVHPTISKRHLSFLHRQGDWLVEDHGSTNGTQLDGSPLEPGLPRKLDDGSSLRVGRGVIVRFFTPEVFYGFCSMVRGSTPSGSV